MSAKAGNGKGGKGGKKLQQQQLQQQQSSQLLNSMQLSASPTSSSVHMMGASTPPENELERVFIWDLDETIIVFHTLISGTFAKNFCKDITMCYNVGYEMETLIFDLAEMHFFLKELMVERKRA